MFKMIVLDIDGTVSEGNNHVSDRVVSVLKHATSVGIHVCLCTGRNLKHSMPIVERIGLDTPIVVLDGCYVYSVKDKKILYKNSLDKDFTKALGEFLRNRKVYIEAHCDEVFYRYCKNNPDYIYGDAFSLSFVTDYEEYDKFLAESDNFFSYVIGGDPKELREISEYIQNNFNDKAKISFLWDNYMNINKSNLGKALGVAQLCNYFSINPKNVVAFGDEVNDLTMLDFVGTGVAMGNAKPPLFKIADAITETVDKDGVAVFLEKYFKENL